MIYTNKYELPEPIYKALTDKTYVGGGDISATSLLKSPRQRQLEKRHDKEIVVDASDMMWSVLGTAVHNLFEKHSKAVNGLTEERLTVEVDGMKVSGQADLLEQVGDNLVLTDYKVSSVWSFILDKGVKPEWEQQLNIYRWLFNKAAGFDVKLLRICGIIRDWKVSDSKKDPSYPTCPIVFRDVVSWPFDKIEAFIKERVALHKAAAELPDDKLPLCTAAERWERPTKYAVMQKGKVRAFKLFDDMNEANACAIDVKGFVQVRPGVAGKCESYCNAAPFCNQYKPAGGKDA